MFIENIKNRKESWTQLLLVVIATSALVNILGNSLFEIFAYPFLWLFLSIILLLVLAAMYYNLFVRLEIFEDAFIYSMQVCEDNGQYYCPLGENFRRQVSYLFQEAIKKPEVEAGVRKERGFKRKLLLDVVEFAVLFDYAQNHVYSWLSHKKIKGKEIRYEKFKNRPKRLFALRDFEDLKNNLAYRGMPEGPTEFALPPDVKIGRYENTYMRIISFRNADFTFNISIQEGSWRHGMFLQDKCDHFSYMISARIKPNKVHWVFSRNILEHYEWAEQVWENLKQSAKD